MDNKNKVMSPTSSKFWPQENLSMKIARTESNDSVALFDDDITSFGSTIQSLSSSDEIKSKITLSDSENFDYEDSNDEKKISSKSDNEIVSNVIGAKLNCRTPYRHKVNNYLHNKVLLFSKVGSFKLDFLTNVSGSESSKEEIREKEDFQERLLERYIGKTLTGWDERGMHYWLHKLEKSNIHLPHVEEIVKDNESWYHIHFCESCIAQLNISQCLQYEKLEYPTEGQDYQERKTSNENIKSLSEDETKFHPHPEQFNQIRDAEDSDIQTGDQYFSRSVYCYNTCGLNFKLFDNNNKRKKKKAPEEPSINPSMKVVVYGTDPCGLNFPVDLDNKESKMNDLLVAYKPGSKIMNTCFNKEDKWDLHSDSSNNTSTLPSTNISEVLFNASKDSFSGTLESYFTNSTSLSQSSTNCTTSFENSKDSLETQTNTSPDSSTITDTNTYSRTTCTQEKIVLGRNRNRFKSFVSYVNMNVQCLEKDKPSLSEDPSLYSMYSNDKLNRKVTGGSRNVYRIKHPIQKKLAEISQRRNNKAGNQKAVYIRCEKRNKKDGEHSLYFSDSASVGVQKIYLRKHYDKIVFKDREKRTKDQQLVPTSVPGVSFFSQIVFYALLIFFLIFSYVLFNDSIRRQPTIPFKPPRKWYDLYD